MPKATGLCALAATENKSAHPRDIHTRVSEASVITGVKSFVTLGNLANTILVVARMDALQPDGRPDLRLCSVPASAAGVTREQLPATPFAPELPHARVTFENAQGELLPGDGYAHYLKPFRTVEDLWVHVALCAWLWGMASRDGWGDAYIADARAAIDDAAALMALDPAAPATHLALGALIDRARDLTERAAFSASAATEKALFERDRPLLWVAERARTKRLSKVRAAIA